MPYGETKVYFDGSHYIVIPHTTRPSRPRRQTVEEVITVMGNAKEDKETEDKPSSCEDMSFPLATSESIEDEQNTQNRIERVAQGRRKA